MATPKDHLPPAHSDDTIRTLLANLSLPPPTAITALQTAAEFHSVYMLRFPPSAAAALAPARAADTDDADGGSVTLVLRVSGAHITRRKTLNEVAVMRWVRENTAVPVPAVLRFDATCDNVLGREFTILERVEGRSVDQMYDELGDEQKSWLVEQLTDVVLELNRHEWKHVGGLRVDEDGRIVPGPVLEDTFWMEPDIDKYWGPEETIDTLNPSGLYDSHAAYIAAYLQTLTHAITVQPSLQHLHTLLPRLAALTALLPSLRTTTEATRLLLAHKDLHFGNVVALPSGQLMGVLDWEFAGAVPAPRWDPVRAFLWRGRHSADAAAEKARLRGLFEEGLARRGVDRWWEVEGQADVGHLWAVVRFVRALVEVNLKGQIADKVAEWKAAAEEALTALGV